MTLYYKTVRTYLLSSCKISMALLQPVLTSMPVFSASIKRNASRLLRALDFWASFSNFSVFVCVKIIC